MEAAPSALHRRGGHSGAHGQTHCLGSDSGPSRYEVHLACDPRYLHLFDDLPFTLHPIRSISTAQFLDALSKGQPLYDVATLRSYVREDMALIDALAPQAIVGDFRLSLSVSARVAGIPYVSITNAHWSPYAKPRYLVPDLALTKKMGVRRGQMAFSLMRPFIFARHAAPLNRVRKEYGLPSVGYSLPWVFTDADQTLYADLPDLVPTFHAPPTHDYMGPIIWSPARRPCWWDALPEDRPAVYVSLGTSGRRDLLPMVLEALGDLKVVVLAATAGRYDLPRIPDRVWIADYLPGAEAAGRTDLMICNGGSASIYQALAAGTPVLGLPSNLDQYLSMSYVCKAGAGELLRAGEASASVIKQAVRQILHSQDYRSRAQLLKSRIAAMPPAERFGQVLERLSAGDPQSAGIPAAMVGTDW